MEKYKGLEGFCPKCYLHYYGWTIANPLEQKCEQCGGDLEIYRDGMHLDKKDCSSMGLAEYKIQYNETGETSTYGSDLRNVRLNTGMYRN